MFKNHNENPDVSINEEYEQLASLDVGERNDTEVYDDLVDVKCQHCHQLIPFNMVNQHSLQCFQSKKGSKEESRDEIDLIEDEFETQV